MTERLQVMLRGLLSTLVPDAQRRTWARDYPIDPPRWSLGLGLVQMLGGGMTFLLGGIAFMRGSFSIGGQLLLDNWFPGMTSTHMSGMGLLGWLAWFIYPLSWPLAYLALVGVIRCGAFAITREALGEPLTVLTLTVWRALRDRQAERALERRLGPLRGDRWVDLGERGAVVLSCRPKPGWSETVTIVHGDRYYRCLGSELRTDGEWQVLAYRLEEQEEGALIRRRIDYAPSFPNPPIRR